MDSLEYGLNAYILPSILTTRSPSHRVGNFPSYDTNSIMAILHSKVGVMPYLIPDESIIELCLLLSSAPYLFCGADEDFPQLWWYQTSMWFYGFSTSRLEILTYRRIDYGRITWCIDESRQV